MSGQVGGVGPQRDLGSTASGEFQAAPAPAPEAQVTRGAAPGGRMAAVASVQVSPDYQRATDLLQAYKTLPAAELTKVLADAKKNDPVAYRAALREFFHEYIGDATKLKLHTMAMDQNNDGWLTFKESYKSMHDMGFHRMRAFLLSAMTSLLLAPQTTPHYSTVLDVANSEKTQRAFFLTGFDSTEQLEGRLDEVMSYDKDKDGFVTLADIQKMVDDRTAKMDSKLGAKAINYLNKGEWQALFSLMDGGKMNRDELRDFYTGSLFFSFLEPDNLAKKLVAYRSGDARALQHPG